MKRSLSFFLLLTLLILAACQSGLPETELNEAVTGPTARVILDNLLNPVGLTALADGTLLVAEEGTGERDLSAGVTALLPDGASGRLLAEFPSSRDSGDLSGVPFVAYADGTLYTSHFQLGHLLTLDLSLPLSLPATPYTPADMAPRMTPLNNVALVNPFALTFSAIGLPVVSDASENGVAIMTNGGQTRFIHRFGALPNPGEGKRTIDAVPTGLARHGDEYLVTLTGGCPFPAGGGRLVAIDENRNERLITDGLNMPIGVQLDENGTIWLLEFATFNSEEGCFTAAGYEPRTGRLSRLTAGGQPEVVLTGLNFPGGLAFGPAGELYISETFSGRVLRVDGVASLPPDTAVSTLLGEPTAVLPSPAATNSQLDLQFVNVAADSGLDFQHGAFVEAISADPAAMMGGGLCWLDYNRDGWLDLYLVNSHALEETDLWLARGGLPHNQLFRNEGGQFSDVSAATQTDLALRGNGCVAADFDMDGWTDIFVTVDGPNVLLWNNRNGTFTEGAAPAGVDSPAWNSAAAVGDINLDGWPDLFVAAYIDLEKMIDRPSGAFPQDFLGLPDHFYVNNGDRTFTDVTAEVGLTREERGLGALFSDFDGDLDLDLYVANDGHPNRMYLNEAADGPAGFRFVDISVDSGTNDSGSGMGIAGGDYDGDGRYDLLVTNWNTELNALFRNTFTGRGAPTFLYSTARIGIAGLGNNMTGWGTAWADFDHDTDQDLLVVNGHVPISDLAGDAQLVRLYANRLAEGLPNSFREWTQHVGLGPDGVGPLLARGSAIADYDNDGDLDVAINSIGGAVALLQNQRTQGNWLMVRLPQFAPGTRIEAKVPDGPVLVREWHAGSSYLASEDPRLHFGLGHVWQVDLIIRWPDGATTIEYAVPANQILTLDR